MLYRIFFAAIVTLSSLHAAAENAAEWPQFRGPGGQGHARASGLPRTWSEQKNVLWKTPIPGRGWSSPVVEAGRIWLTTSHKKLASAAEAERKLAAVPNPQGIEIASRVVLRAVCVDLETGQLLHDVELMTIDEPEPIHSLNSFASPTPVLDHGRLYCHFGTYGTLCLDTESLEIVWTNHDLKLDHQNGPGSSPILWRDLLIFHGDGLDVQFIAALDKATGELIWKAPRSGTLPDRPEFRKAYCTPLVIEGPRGRTQLISPAADWVYSYDPATGQELWRANYGKLGFSNVARPVYSDGIVYICTCFTKSSLLAIRCDGEGDVTDSHIVWRYDKQVPRIPSPILVGQSLYMVSDGGIATCLDARTGELQWHERLGGNFTASPTFADGRLYFFNREGQAFVLTPGATFAQPQINELEGEFMASPVPLGRSLLLRTDSHLYRVQLTDESRPAETAWKRHQVLSAPGQRINTAVGGDFTGDGQADVICNVGGKTLLLAAPQWRQVVLDDNAEHNLIHSESWDVDGDGDLDYIGARYMPGKVLWLEQPQRPLQERWPLRVIDDQINGIHGLLQGDVDGDGRLDLLANSAQPAGPFPNSAVWLQGPKDPRKVESWPRHVFARGDAPGLSHYLGFGDVNGDGRPDMALAAKGGPQAEPGTGEWFAWWEAPADPRQAWTKHLLADGQPGATNIQQADVNGDGRTDFFATRGHDRGVLWFEAPSWKIHTIHATLKEPHSLTVADLDGDGDVDCATCAYGDRRAMWFENDGRGQFKHHLVAEDQAAYDIRAVDMDSDGDLDLLIAGQESHNVAWYENPLR